MVRLRLFGSAELTQQCGATIGGIVDQPKLLGLVAYLALSSRSRSVRRDSLLAMFWPESNQSSARHALSQALSVLRKALGPEVLDGKYRGSVRLDADQLWCDAVVFREAVEQGRFEDALELYTGPLLEGVYLRDVPGFERWIDDERRELHGHALEATLKLCDLAVDARAQDEAQKWAERAIQLDRYCAQAWRRLMASLVDSGNAVGALREYERMSSLFREDLGLDPPQELKVLVASIHAGRAPKPSEQSSGSASVLFEPSEREVGRSPQAEGVAPGIDDEVVPSGDYAGRARTWLRPGRLAVLAVVTAVVIPLSIYVTQQAPAGVDPGSMRSIAVLPLVDRNPEQGDEYLPDALTAEIGRELGYIEGLEVASHRSARLSSEVADTPRAMAHLLGVDLLLEGEVQRRSSGIAIVLRLVDPMANRVVWSGSYQSRLGELPLVRRRIASEIEATILGTSLPAVEQEQEALPADRAIAYEAYLRGLHHLERYNTEEAVVAGGYLKRSVELDSSSAPAFAALARACAWVWDSKPPPDEFAPCERAARTAIRLDPSMADGHAALGFVLNRKLVLGLDPKWDWNRPEQAFRRAVALNPNSADALEDYAELLRMMRRDSEARLALERALELNPLSVGLKLRIGIQHLDEGRFRAALDVWDEILTIDPTYATAHYARGATYISMRMPEEVLASADLLARRLDDEDNPWVHDLRAHAYALTGDRRRALHYVDRVAPDPVMRSSVELVLGDTARALDLLEAAIQQQRSELPNFTASARYNGVRAHPRFIAIRKAIGLQ